MSASRIKLGGLALIAIAVLGLGAFFLNEEEPEATALPQRREALAAAKPVVLTPYVIEAQSEEESSVSVARAAPSSEPDKTGALELSLIGAAPERVHLLLDFQRLQRPYGDGLLRFEDLKAGTHSVGLLWPERGLASPRRLETVLIKAGETTRLGLRYPVMAAIEGLLRGPEGQPLEGGGVVLQGLYIPVDREGRFRCRTLPAGHNRVWLFHPELGAVEAEALDLAEGEVRRLDLSFRPQGQAALFGEVRRGGAFASGAAIVLRRLDQDRRPVIRSIKADERGAFSMRYLAAGRYAIEVDGKAVREVALGPRTEQRVDLFLNPEEEE